MFGRITWLRPGLGGVALAAAVVTVASGSAGLALTARAASPVRLSASALPSVVPWRQAGPGWAVAQYSASSALYVTPRFTGPMTLYLTSPQGRKYPFYSWPGISSGFSLALLDWSGDRQRVLLTRSVAAGRTVVEQISLVTGKVVSKFTLPAGVSPVGYTRPSGLNLLAYRGSGIARYDLAGHLKAVLLAKGGGLAIESPDGTTVIVGSATGLKQVSNLGGVIRRFAAPVAVDGCQPVRWWNATTVLASCVAKAYIAPRLWLFPVGGGKVTALTAQRGNSGPDFGDIAAWKLTSGVYLQALGACGVQFIARQRADGSVYAVNIPGTPNVSNRIITGAVSRLLVQAETGCGGSDSLVWFNPSTRSVSFVFSTPHKISGVQVVIPYGRPLA